MREKTAADYSREIETLHRSLDEETRRKMKLKAEKRAADELLKTPDITEYLAKKERYSQKIMLWSAAGAFSVIMLLAIGSVIPVFALFGGAVMLFVLGIVFMSDPSANAAQSRTISALMLFISGALIYRSIYMIKDESVPEGYGLLIFSVIMLLLILRCSIMYLKLLFRVIYLRQRCDFRVEAECTGCATKAGCYTIQPRYSRRNSKDNGIPEEDTPSGDPAYLIRYKGDPIVLDEGRWNRFGLPSAGEVRTLYIDPFRADIFYDPVRYREELNYAAQQMAVPLALILLAGNIAAYTMSYFG